MAKKNTRRLPARAVDRRARMNCVEHEVPADGNIFLALGFEPGLAARLLEATDREIEAKQMIEDQLLNELTSWVESRKHDPDTPVNIFGNKPSDIDRVLKAKGQKLNIDQLITYLITTGRNVEVVVT